MKLHRSMLVIVNIALTIPLLLYGYFGLSSRYLADDFCTSAHYRSQGFIASILFWRETWSGRFSFFFFMNVLHWIGTWITPFMTIFILLAWLGALYVLMRQLFRFLHLSDSGLACLLLANIILFATLNGTPDRYQSLYWLTGQVTYTFPLVFLTVYLAGLLNRLAGPSLPSWKGMLLSAAITFIAGGFSETYVVVQLAAILALALLIWFFAAGDRRRSGLRWLASGAVGAVLALILVVTAPGNALRMETMPDRIGITELVVLTLHDTLFFVKNAIYLAPFTSLLAFLMPGLLRAILPADQGDASAAPKRSSKKLAAFLIAVPVIALGLMASTIAPSLYATADYPVGRVLITAQFVLICALGSWGMLLSLALRPVVKILLRYPVPIRVGYSALIIIVVIFSVRGTLSGLPKAQDFAHGWDSRDQKIQVGVTSGEHEMKAASLPHISPGLGELSTDPNDWVNQCVAMNYGLDKVTGK